MKGSLQVLAVGGVPLTWIPGGTQTIYATNCCDGLPDVKQDEFFDGIVIRGNSQHGELHEFIDGAWEKYPGAPLVILSDQIGWREFNGVPVLPVPAVCGNIASCFARQKEAMRTTVFSCGGPLPKWANTLNTVLSVEGIWPKAKQLNSEVAVVCPSGQVDDYVVNILEEIKYSDLPVVVMIDHPASDWGEVGSFPVVHSQQYVWEGSRQIPLPVTIESAIAAAKRPCGAHAS